MINIFKTLNNYLSRMPSALSGLALAIASLALCWDNVANSHGQIKILGAILAGALIIPLILKFLFNPELLKQDLQHPIAGSVAPTLTMAAMVIANSLALYSFKFAEIVSFIAIMFHVYFLVYFIYYRVKNFKFTHILPSWFIPPIGMVLAVMTYPGGLEAVFAEQLLDFALISYALLLPLVLWRLFFSEKLSDGEKPFIVILATPASLLLACYFVITPQANYLFVWCFVLLALFMTLSVYLAFIKLLRLPFTPAYAAFTFPLVIGAIALFKTSEFLLQEGIPVQVANFVEHLANAELMIATLVVFYVAFRYVLHFLPIKKTVIQ